MKCLTIHPLLNTSNHHILANFLSSQRLTLRFYPFLERNQRLKSQIPCTWYTKTALQIQYTKSIEFKQEDNPKTCKGIILYSSRILLCLYISDLTNIPKKFNNEVQASPYYKIFIILIMERKTRDIGKGNQLHRIFNYPLSPKISPIFLYT